MKRSQHSYVMVGLLAVGAVLVFSGAVGGGALFLLWPLACMGMMLAMMWGMGGMRSQPDHTHGTGSRTRNETSRRRPR